MTSWAGGRAPLPGEPGYGWDPYGNTSSPPVAAPSDSTPVASNADPYGDATAGMDTPGVFGNVTSPAWQTPQAFSYGLDQYRGSPAYQWQMDQGQKAVLASHAATGSLRSGAALKELQDRAQQMAYKDYGNERAFAYGQYGDDRNFGRGLYENDRNYLTNRYDTQTDNLFNYTQMGGNAVTGTANAATGVGNATADTALANGANRAGNAVAQGNIWSGVASDLGGIAKNYLTGLGTGGGSIDGYLNNRMINKVPY